MGITPTRKINLWIEAAGQKGKSDSVRKRVIKDYWTQNRIFENLKPYPIGPIARYLKVAPEELLKITITGDLQEQESLIRQAIKKESKTVLKQLLGASAKAKPKII